MKSASRSPGWAGQADPFVAHPQAALKGRVTALYFQPPAQATEVGMKCRAMLSAVLLACALPLPYLAMRVGSRAEAHR